MSKRDTYPNPSVWSASLYNADTSSTPVSASAHTRSELIACITTLHGASPIAGTDSELWRDVIVRAKNEAYVLGLTAKMGGNVCLSHKFLEEIITILLLCSEDYEFALAAEDGELIDIRERKIQ